MSREFFKNWNPSYKSKALICNINEILTDYKEMGYKLTLRQLYYQLVSRGIIPNSMSEYNKIGNVVSNGRLAGLMDWDMIEDRVRIPNSRSHFDSPKDVLEAASYSYYRSRWDDQSCYVEVWCEKDAVSNIIQPVCRKYDVTFMANRGYSSQSAMYEASQRFTNAHFEGKELHLIYLGDHDPSGIDMSRDITDRMELFLGWRDFVAEEDIPLANHRIALNMDQVEKYNPPKNPAKMTDSRFKSYVESFGYSSWELDALEPKILESLIDDKINSFIDFDKWNKVVELEKEHKERINKIATDFVN